MTDEPNRPTLESIRAWWRRTRADETCPLTKGDWDELDVAIRADERARLAAALGPFEGKAGMVADILCRHFHYIPLNELEDHARVWKWQGNEWRAVREKYLQTARDVLTCLGIKD